MQRFIFILINNLIGMVPYSFASTSHFLLTFALSFTIVLVRAYGGRCVEVGAALIQYRVYQGKQWTGFSALRLQ